MPFEQRNHSRGLVFDIQRFCIHDGPGIRTVVFFKGCLLNCAWCQNPESQKPVPEIAFYPEACHGCFACRSICPEGSIADGASQHIDRTRCTVCGDCVGACPYGGLRMVGTFMEAEALADELVKDKDFFDDSGGGITFSGGEPMLQAEFLEHVVPMLTDRGIPVLLETSGLFKREHRNRVFPLVDRVFFDLKHMDPARHKQYTGRSNLLILEHFSYITNTYRNVQARMPVIPGINDDEANIRATARFLRQEGHDSIHCLPYHPFGETKHKRLGLTGTPLPINHPDPPEACRRAATRFEHEEIHAVVYE